MPSRLFSCLFLLALLPALATAQAPPSSARAAQQEAARQWLELIDQGRVEDAWNAGDAQLRRERGLAQWRSELGKHRGPAPVRCRRELVVRELEQPARTEILFLSRYADDRLVGEWVTVSGTTTPRVSAYRSGPPVPDRPDTACPADEAAKPAH